MERVRARRSRPQRQTLSVRQKVASLSGGQRQTVAIAKAVLWNSKVVMLDEPTAALGVAQTKQVLDLVRRLAEQGLGVVIISHNIEDVFEVADRITVLRLGPRRHVRRPKDGPRGGRRGHHRGQPGRPGTPARGPMATSAEPPDTTPAGMSTEVGPAEMGRPGRCASSGQTGACGGRTATSARCRSSSA